LEFFYEEEDMVDNKASYTLEKIAEDLKIKNKHTFHSKIYSFLIAQVPLKVSAEDHFGELCEIYAKEDTFEASNRVYFEQKASKRMKRRRRKYQSANERKVLFDYE
jgi:hypothetical protein